MKREYKKALEQIKAALPAIGVSAAVLIFVCAASVIFSRTLSLFPQFVAPWLFAAPPEPPLFFEGAALLSLSLQLLFCGAAIAGGLVPFLWLPLLLCAWCGLSLGARLCAGQALAPGMALPLCAFLLCSAMGTRICLAASKRLTPAPRKIRRAAVKNARPTLLLCDSLRVFALVCVPLLLVGSVANLA